MKITGMEKTANKKTRSRKQRALMYKINQGNQSITRNHGYIEQVKQQNGGTKLNMLAEMSKEYVSVIEVAKKVYEKTGNTTTFRRMDEQGSTKFIVIKHDITVYTVVKHKQVAFELYNDAQAVTEFSRGGWECLKP